MQHGDARRMSVRVTARSISRPVWERLWERPFAGRVLAVFERACNLITPDGNLVALVFPQVGDGPLNIVTDGKPSDFRAVEPGMPAWLEGRRLRVGGLEVALEEAVVWEPRPDWDSLRAHRDAFTDRFPFLQALSLRHAPAGSFLVLAVACKSWGSEPFDCPQDRRWLSSETYRDQASGSTNDPLGLDTSLRSYSIGAGLVLSPMLPQFLAGSFGSASDVLFAAAQEAAEALQAGWEGDPAQLRAGAAQLAGLGGGLTPAGDDFLIGAMLWGWLTHPTPRPLCRSLLEAAAPRTTTLSAAFLRAAAEGECSAPWHRLLAALQSGTEVGEPLGLDSGRRLSRAVRDVLSHGSTSGADTLAGFLWMAKQRGAACTTAPSRYRSPFPWAGRSGGWPPE